MTRKRLANDHLPQGAPTSPGLSNLCSFRLDRRLHGLARTFEATYTRYADDLIFSGDLPLQKSPSRFLTWVNAILIDEGFTLHSRKTRIMPNSQRQHVCGLSLNERPNISRRQFDQLKATLRNCAIRGPQHENRANILRFREHLQGRVAWVTQVNPRKGARLQAIYNTIDWSEQQ